jgi:YHS domain-containing protein
MSIDDVLASQIECGAESYAVCGKSLAGSSAHTRLKYGERMVALCCPLCLETFQKSPEDWTRRGETRHEVRAIFDLLRPNPPTQ